MRRLLHAGAVGAAVDRGPRFVVHAEADHGPAVVAAAKNEVQLVPPLRPVLGDPHVSRFASQVAPIFFNDGKSAGRVVYFYEMSLEDASFTEARIIASAKNQGGV